MSNLMTLRGVTPSAECTIVAQDFLLSLRETEDGDGFEYDLAEIRFGYLGEELAFRHMDSGAVTWSRGDLDADRMLVAVAGALPDGFADVAVAISETACPLTDGVDVDEVCDSLGATYAELVAAIRRAQEMGDGRNRLTSGCVGVTDCDGRLIRIGDWIRADGDGTPRRVLGVGITELAGRVVMVDNPVEGPWLRVTDGVRVVSTGATSWEEFVELARCDVFPKEELVRMARDLAGRLG